MHVLPFLNGQNRISNPGFESHLKPLTSAWFLNKADFSQIVKDWECFSYGYDCVLFTNNYEPKSSEVSLGYDLKKHQPHSGQSMMQLWITPRGGKCMLGSGGYIQTSLMHPLSTQKVYSLSLWVYILKSDGTYLHPEFCRNFGITFADYPFKLTDSDCALINDSPFTIDTVQLGQWFKLDYIIRPSRQLNKLAIGAFYNPHQPYIFHNKDSNKSLNYYFFIDDIDVHEIIEPDSTTWGNAILYPFLGRPTLENPPKNTKLKESFCTNIFFDSDSCYPKPGSYQVLDSLILRMKTDRNIVYSLTGYTDDIGNDNITLSKCRAGMIKSYLMNKGKIPEYRFEVFGYGSDNAIASNNNEAGRKLNRRVEIRESNSKVTTALYRSASKAVTEGKIDSAFYFLRAWLSFDSTDKMLLLYDTDLNPLQSHPSWKNIESNIRDSYKKYSKPSLSYQLDALYCKDQLYRSIGTLYKEAKGYVPVGIDTLDFINDSKLVAIIDSINLITLISILEKEHWPNPLTVGERQSKTIPYVLLHCRNYNVMKKYLPHLEQACKDNIASWEHYATLYDRIQLQDKGTQRYGTQYKVDEEDPELYNRAPLEHPEQVDNLRASIGLPPLSPNSSFRIKKNKK